jgi:putative spermidine/putrescine transport system permease protein
VRGKKPIDIENLIISAMTFGVVLFILSPIVFVLIISFTSGDTLEFPPPGWSFQWYLSAIKLIGGASWRVERLTSSLLTSGAIAGMATILSVGAGVPASYALVRYRFKGKLLVEQLVTLPLVFPLIVLGVSLLVMASRLGFGGGFWAIVIAHVIITFPFVVRNCVASLEGISITLEEAASTLGANWLRTFWEIVLPLMRPGILSGMLIAFIISFNEFTVSYFLYTVDVFPFPIWLFTRANSSLDPTIFSLSSAVIFLDIGLILLLDRVVGKSGVPL